jgi:hypothetical protein
MCEYSHRSRRSVQSAGLLPFLARSGSDPKKPPPALPSLVSLSQKLLRHGPVDGLHGDKTSDGAEHQKEVEPERREQQQRQRHEDAAKFADGAANGENGIVDRQMLHDQGYAVALCDIDDKEAAKVEGGGLPRSGRHDRQSLQTGCQQCRT